jgi:hypothetical protein
MILELLTCCSSLEEELRECWEELLQKQW